MKKRLLKTKKYLLLLCLLMHTIAVSFAQNATVNGTVTDKVSGETMPGVAVMVKGTSRGTVTDADGRYNIQVSGDADILVFSFVGYLSQEVPVKGRSTINLALAEDVESLEEVVVVGYGTQKKATLTGSVSEVQGKEIVQSPQPNVSNSLSGRIPGVIANNRGGEPGYDGSTISIRGLATTGNNDVLVVVDGVPGQIGGLDRLDPNDIESVTVLKDASAAIYGSRAANGVILVTTKRGKTGKPTISYTFNQGFSSPTRLPRLADAGTYAQIRNEIAYYNNPDGGLNQVYSDTELQKFRDGSDPLLYPNTNWQEEALQKVALQNQHNLSVSGGTEKISYFLSLGKLFQDGLYKDGATKYNQYNFRSNVEADITDKLTMGLFLSGRQEDRQFPTRGAGDIFRSIYRAYPTVAARYPNGLPSTGIENNNPIMMATNAGGIHTNPAYIFNGILKGSYELPINGLSVDGFYSIDRSFSTSKSFSTPYTLYRYNATTGEYEQTIAGGGPNGKAQLEERSTTKAMTVGNIKLNFQQYFGNHHVNSFVGYEQSRFRDQGFGAFKMHYPTTQTPELSQGGSAATDDRNWGSSYNFTRRSFIGRLAYDYSEKYLAEVQLRADGSSTFPKDKQWGFFPSVSAGWRISEEEFFKNNVPFVNNLKLRASWGQLGNDNVGQFQFYDNYSLMNYYVIGGQVQPGIDLTKLGNPNITWEVATKTDLGITATILKNIDLELVYFKQERNNILASRNASIPATTGIVNPHNHGGNDYVPLVPDENIGKVNSRGLEAILSYHRSSGDDFSYGFSGNLTYAKNKLIFKDEAPGLLAYQRETGRPLYTYLLYNTIGIYRTEDDLDRYPSVPGAKVGDLIYEDVNGDGEISADDMLRTKYGNIPQLTFGLSMNAGWRNFDFSVLFSGQSRVSQYVLPESGTIGNFYSSWADNRWSPSNPNGTYPRVDERASSAISGGLYRNNFWLNDASFVRLKNIQFGYTLPASLLSKVSISDVRIYANAFNLLTFTKVNDYDPEGNSESGQFYPQQRIINLGVNVKF